jgi:hypothetical protein
VARRLGVGEGLQRSVAVTEVNAAETIIEVQEGNVPSSLDSSSSPLETRMFLRPLLRVSAAMRLAPLENDVGVRELQCLTLVQRSVASAEQNGHIPVLADDGNIRIAVAMLPCPAVAYRFSRPTRASGERAVREDGPGRDSNDA